MDDPELLRAYLATTWTVWSGEESWVLHIGAPAPCPSAVLPVGIVTAYNPGSRQRTPSQNRAANGRLEDRLRDGEERYLAALAHGTGPDASAWDEPGFAVLEADLGRMIALGRNFGQNAIVWAPEGPTVLVVTRPGFCGRAVGDTLEPHSELP